jgi:hypothetical protein
LALEAALRFHSHGAALTWFLVPHAEGAGSGIQTELGKSYLKNLNLDVVGVWEDAYYRPLVSMLGSEQRVLSAEVISITKRYLAPQEKLPEQSRFSDLFRLIYQIDPQDFIQEQRQNNLETYERLSEEFVNSLQSKIEMYEDFDLVLDLRAADKSASLAVTGKALGESRVSPEFMLYGKDAFHLAQSITIESGVRDIAIVGSNFEAAACLLSLREWLSDLRTRLFIVSTEAIPFQKCLDEAQEIFANEVRSLIKTCEDEFENDINVFHQKLREWQALDDFVQAKIPRPAEPIPRLVFFSGHNATAVDQLIDKRKLFLTLEKPDFRMGLKQPENNLLELKTIGCDRILVCQGYYKEKIDFLDHQEKGFFNIELSHPLIKKAWERDLEKLKGIENEIFKLFSPLHPS